MQQSLSKNETLFLFSLFTAPAGSPGRALERSDSTALTPMYLRYVQRRKEGGDEDGELQDLWSRSSCLGHLRPDAAAVPQWVRRLCCRRGRAPRTRALEGRRTKPAGPGRCTELVHWPGSAALRTARGLILTLRRRTLPDEGRPAVSVCCVQAGLGSWQNNGSRDSLMSPESPTRATAR